MHKKALAALELSHYWARIKTCAALKPIAILFKHDSTETQRVDQNNELPTYNFPDLRFWEWGSHYLKSFSSGHTNSLVAISLHPFKDNYVRLTDFVKDIELSYGVVKDAWLLQIASHVP